MDKLKILYISDGYTIGGVETYLAESLKYHKLYDPIGIITHGRFRCYEYLKERFTGNLIDLRGGGGPRKKIIAIYNALRFIKNNDIKLVISHGIRSWFVGGSTAKLSNLKSIFYVHDEIKKVDFRYPISAISLRIKPTFYVANSKFTAKSIRQFLNGNIKVNYLGLDIKQFDSIDDVEAKRRLRSEFNISENTFIFSLISRIQEWKGHDTAIHAFKNMRHKKCACLLIVGECSAKSDERFYNYLKKISRDDNSIIFTGFREDIPYIMKGSDVITHTSRKPEPFGMVLIEGMMARKPVIATAHGGPLEIIENGKDGLLFEPQDYTRLSKIMDNLIEDEQLRKKLSEEAYKKARLSYTIEASVDRFEKIINDLIGEGGKTG